MRDANPCLDPRLMPTFNSERSRPEVKPKFPRLAWLRKKKAELEINEEFLIVRVGGFYEKQ
jgi:hypothetical protein